MIEQETHHPASSGGQLRVDSAAWRTGRRAFLRSLGLGATGALVSGQGVGSAAAQSLSAADVFNFALNFEYLGYRFYNIAANGYPPPAYTPEQVAAFLLLGLFNGQISALERGFTGGTGTAGLVMGGHKVPFADPLVQAVAQEFGTDELGHVKLLRTILGPDRFINQPSIDLDAGFTAFARFSGLTSPTGTFDAFANDTNFLIGAFILEDVCVTALKGAVPLIRDNEFLEAAAGLLATEAYQAGIIRTLMAERGLFTQAQQVSDLRDYLDGPSDIDQGIGSAQQVNIVPADANAIAFGRTPEQVRNIAYGTTDGQPGGFFPTGLNGAIR